MKRQTAVSLWAIALLVGCSDVPTVPQIGEPFFYLVLYPGEDWGSLEGTNYAMALTLNSTVDVRCRDVESILMRRDSDSAPFAWRAEGTCQHVFIPNPHLQSAACCTLPDADGDSLGARDLRPGETYVLDVMTEGVHITGRTTVPGPFSVRVVEEGGATVAVWSKSAGADGYAVTDGSFEVRLTRDTTLILPGDPAERFIHVEALELNMYSYLVGGSAREILGSGEYRDLVRGPVRSGISTGRGVFGAMWSPGRMVY